MNKLAGALAVFVAALFGGVAFAAPTPGPYFEQPSPHTHQIYGVDRYGTSVAVSRFSSPFTPPWDHNNTVTVYLASGQNFPDALAMSASAGDGPLLLVQRDAVPDIVVQEVQRLVPCQIVAVGGPTVISPAVIAQLDQYTDGANGSLPNPKCATG